MTDKACLRGNDSPALTRSVSMLDLQKFLRYPLGDERLQNPVHPFLASEQQFPMGLCGKHQSLQ